MKVIAGFHDVAAIARMPYRQFGATKDRVISAISLGGSAIGGVFAPLNDVAAAHETVKASLRAGVNLIDTAPWYGHGESERREYQCQETEYQWSRHRYRPLSLRL